MIVFSVRELYEVAARLRRERGGAALVFGALSPRTRNAQVGALPGRARWTTWWRPTPSAWA